jgi:hypothetical protein
MAGSEQIIPVQAMVIIFLAPSLFTQETITGGTGYSIVPGFHISFDIIIPLSAVINQIIIHLLYYSIYKRLL